MSVEVPSEEPLPSIDKMREYLIKERPGYDVDYARSSIALGRITMTAVSGPTGAGKSTLVREVVKNNPEFHQYLSSTTRERLPRDGDEYVTATEGMSFEKFYRAVQQRAIVNYFVSPTGHAYGTFLDGFKPKYTIGAIGVDSIDQLRLAGFDDFEAIYPVMDGETYAGRIGLDRIHNPDALPRLVEGVSSLGYAKEHADRQELRFIKLSNVAGALQASAEDVVRIVRHDTVGTLDTTTALKYIDEMEAVVREAIHRIKVQ